MSDWSRRRFLQTAGLAGLGLTAACGGGGSPTASSSAETPAAAVADHLRDG